MHTSYLQSLGLCDEEIKIYLSCLEYGQLPVSTISRLTKIGRVNCYHYAEKLLSKGLLSISEKNKIKTFVAQNPKIFVEQEEEKLAIAKALLPELTALSGKNSVAPKIRFFEGKEGIKNIFDQMTSEENAEVVSFSNFQNLSEFFEENFLRTHFTLREKKNIKTRFISPRSGLSEVFSSKFFTAEFQQKVEVFLIDPSNFFFESEISIFSGNIAIMNLKKNESVGVLIQNPELFRTQKAIFDLAWLGATSFITQ